MPPPASPTSFLPCRELWTAALVLRFRVGIFVISGCLVLLGFAPTLSAVIMRNNVASSEYEAFSEQFHGQALWIKYTRPDGIRSYCSAFRLNDHWGLTAAHCVLINGSRVTDISVGTSANRNLPEEGEMRAIVQVIIHPTYAGDSWGTSTDVALIKFDRPLPGPSVRIGTVQLGDVIRGVGYGRPATPSLGYLPTDGIRRAYQIKTYNPGSTASGWYPTCYWFQFYPGRNGTLPLEGGGMPGDSGSGMFNSSGDLVAILVTASPTSPYEYITNTATRLDLIKPWIDANATVPLLPSLTCVVSSTEVQISFANLITAREYRVMRSHTFSDWQEAQRFTTTSSTATWNEPLTSEGRMFYRLEWDE